MGMSSSLAVYQHRSSISLVVLHQRGGLSSIMRGMSPLAYSVDCSEEARAPQRPARSVKARAPFPVLGAKALAGTRRTATCSRDGSVMTAKALGKSLVLYVVEARG